jgi:hypothetical protein
MTNEPPFISDRVNVWMRYRDRWVIHTKDATRYHASFHEDADHPVLPIGEEPADGNVDSEESRVRTYDRDGVPHDDVLRTKTGKIITEEDIARWAEEAAEGHPDA